ncbi:MULTISPECIES: sulfite exporter TauE/SafE family protein [unclassified Thioalkalivibrio]|uniref:sulfite exporter TauE/SafE family protein n=1 Tax=unclassified Thioalkalivibrio TaxID=2621013 RepID=UPI000366AEF8|nr:MULTISPECIES: sulfite exporter TauE/SafE family protein [unclassified Thioalkalivibrio]
MTETLIQSPLALGLLFVALGLVAGIPAGMFGIGGGLILVPVFVAVFSLLAFDSASLVQLAVGSSLGAIIPTAILSARAHHRRGGVDGAAVRRLLPGIIVGALIGAWLATRIDSDHLGRIFGAFEVAIGIWMLLNIQPPEAPVPRRSVWLGGGALIGAISSLIGIGGGTLTTPFLVSQGLELRRAIGSAAALGVPIAIGASLVFALPQWTDPTYQAPEWALGYLYLPAILGVVIGTSISVRGGVWLTHHLPVAHLRRGFAGVLILAGLLMLIR